MIVPLENFVTALSVHIDLLHVISWAVHRALFLHNQRSFQSNFVMISINIVKWCVYIGNFQLHFTNIDITDMAILA